MKPTATLLATLLLLLLLPLPLTALHAADTPIELAPAHRAAVDQQRRIFFQYDPAADIQRTSELPHRPSQRVFPLIRTRACPVRSSRRIAGNSPERRRPM